MSTPLNLYRVHFKSSYKLPPVYVVAPDSHSAYLRARGDLDARDYAFPDDRQLDRVDLMAEDKEYAVPTRLYLPLGGPK